MTRRYFVVIACILALPLGTFAAEDKSARDKSSSENATIVSELIEKINFKDDSFGAKVQTSIVTGLEATEAWRTKVAESLSAPIEKVEESRKDLDTMKPEIKAMSFLHLWAIKILKFIISVGFIFYTLAVVVALVVIKKLFAFLKWVFRRKADQV
jgi:hypothetical protein